MEGSFSSLVANDTIRTAMLVGRNASDRHPTSSDLWQSELVRKPRIVFPNRFLARIVVSVYSTRACSMYYKITGLAHSHRSAWELFSAIKRGISRAVIGKSGEHGMFSYNKFRH
ncbi:hypothetical protein SCLCIDRAFT_658917 [Scleroderma citrinum Foug A]|uniref:Uncharacterized protein n=1 Tax=Scleroderma citrinum Foug A TaxID=1036808 RepID=A0A0C3DU43_9AGAM|nr:hypothetical protein SCLCIDRAFT_658917 [Scleroderma citrinum Foug A]